MKKKKFSVLLMYPEHVADRGPESFYDFVTATDVESAIRRARLNLTRHLKAVYWDTPAEREELMDDCSVHLVLSEWHERLVAP